MYLGGIKGDEFGRVFEGAKPDGGVNFITRNHTKNAMCIAKSASTLQNNS